MTESLISSILAKAPEPLGTIEEEKSNLEEEIKQKPLEMKPREPPKRYPIKPPTSYALFANYIHKKMLKNKSNMMKAPKFLSESLPHNLN